MPSWSRRQARFAAIAEWALSDVRSELDAVLLSLWSPGMGTMSSGRRGARDRLDRFLQRDGW